MENNKEYQKWLEVVEKDSSMLESVPEELKSPELCEIAVTNSGEALKFVPEELKTKKLCELAVTPRDDVEYDKYDIPYVFKSIPETQKTYSLCEIVMSNLYDYEDKSEFLVDFVPDGIREELADDFGIELPNKTVQKGRQL